MNADTIAHVASLVEQHGTDAWYLMEVADLLPEGMRGQADQYKKASDVPPREICVV